MSRGRPRGGAEASCKAIGRNRPHREDRSTIQGSSQRVEDLPCDAAAQRRGGVAQCILREGLLGDCSSRGRKLYKLMDKRKGRGTGRPYAYVYTFHGTGGQSGTRPYQHGRKVPLGLWSRLSGVVKSYSDIDSKLFRLPATIMMLHDATHATRCTRSEQV